MIIFKEIEIIGLFGDTDVKIPIQDNRIIIVGYNGIGKSTILNIFYYFISQQWQKLGELDFSSISIRLKNNNRKLSVNHTELIEYIESQRRNTRSYSKYGYRNISFSKKMLQDAYQAISKKNRNIENHNNINTQKSSLRSNIEIIREEIGVPMRIAEHLAREIHYMTSSEFDFESSAHENMAKVDKFLSQNLEGRILYLPTYRRIEKDIKTVFPEIEEEIQRKLSKRRYESLSNESYIELVQFGMEDVKENLAGRLESVKAYDLSQ